MAVYSENISLSTKGEIEIIDITSDVQNIVKNSAITQGLACVFVAGSTGAITTLEYEPGLLEDLPKALEKLASKGIIYKHHETWHDGNGHSHVRSSLVGPSLTVPIHNGALVHGTWQQIVFIELDVRPRTRNITVQIVGE
jgi:secondary thiamine-phosphate synthase enzyme